MTRHYTFKFRPFVVPIHCHPAVRFMYQQLNEQKLTLSDLQNISGVGRTTFTNWRKVQSPKLTDMEAVLNSLGFKLAIIPMEDPPQ